MKFSLNWLNNYTSLPIGDEKKLNEIIDLIALQIVDVDERWVDSSDAIIDIDNKIITNRPYDFGHRGMAKEISIMLDKNYSGKDYPAIPSPISNLPLEIHVNDTDLAPRFSAVAIKGIKVGPSPDFIKNALEKLGVRSINNIVDITNFIMLDTAQPVHAYDYNKLSGNKIIVRRANPEEKITTLDGVERVLNENILLITDAEKPVGIAGVMGAQNSEIDNSTTDIVLEVASFTPISIRKTAKYLKHRTDAVTRFEKGIDPNNIPNVMAYLIKLILENCGGEVATDFIDINNLHLSSVRVDPLIMDFNPNRVDKLLGFNLDNDFIKKILNGFDISIEEKSSDHWVLNIPSSRPDIKEEADIIEDVGRMFGYQNIPTVTPVNQLIIPPINNKVKIKKIIRNVLTASGLDESITYSMISQKDVDTFNLENSVNIVNPLSEDYTFMRASLLPSLAKVVSLNAKHTDDFGIFEIAKIFKNKNTDKLAYEEDKGKSMQPDEIETLSLMYYSKTKKEGSVFILRNALENLLNKLGIKNYRITPQGEVKLNEEIIGDFGFLTTKQIKHYEINYPVSYLTIFLESLYTNFSETKQYIPYSKFQSSKINYSVILPESTAASILIDRILELNLSIIKDVYFLGDVYRDQKTTNNKSISIEILLQKIDGNLTDDEIYNTGLHIEEKIKSISEAEIKGGGIQRKKQLSNPSIEVAEVRPIIAGEILSIEKHPNADKLVVTQINTGSANYQIVTGAPNINVGDIVPVALPGSSVPGLKDDNGNNIIMKIAKLRGIDSYGMLLAGDELGINSDHEGIHLLDSSRYKPGDIIDPGKL